MELSAIEQFVDEIAPESTSQNSTYSAVVSRIDNEGTIWVNLAGSNMETPTASTSSEIEPNDAVTVEWRNNKLYIVGNTSNPSAGGLRVDAVERATAQAQLAAQSAVQDAGIARQAAESAQADADSAHTAATNASDYASRALGNLSTVQSVTETLNWITQHGTMTLTTDTALDPTHVYFVLDSNGDYTVGSSRYSIVSEPNTDDLGSYYELSIDESLNNYVGTHLAVDGEGLWLIPENNGGVKVLIATGSGTTYNSAGTYFIGKDNGVDTVLASFRSNGVQIGQDKISSVTLDNESLKVYDVNGDVVATIAEESFFGRFAWSRASFQSGFFTLGHLKSGNIRKTETFTGDGTLKKFNLSELSASISSRDATCKIDGVTYNDFVIKQVIPVGAQIQLDEAPADGASIVVTYYTTSPYIDVGYRAQDVRGKYSTGIGYIDSARGNYAVAMNYMTNADYEAQTAMGKYNALDANAALIIGNGTSRFAQSNAMTVDWNGNIRIAIDTSATSGEDFELYTAISNLGWDSDVIA